jgi:hypothetical protein
MEEDFASMSYVRIPYAVSKRRICDVSNTARGFLKEGRTLMNSFWKGLYILEVLSVDKVRI